MDMHAVNRPRLGLARRVAAPAVAAFAALLLCSAPALAGNEFRLPDARAYEMVSPPNKHGAGIPLQGGAIQAAEQGGAFVFSASAPTGGAAPGEVEGNRALEFSQVYATRGADGGWRSSDITVPSEEVPQLEFGNLSEYKLFSSDLSQALVEPTTKTPLPPLTEGAEQTIYRRDNTTGGFLPLVTAANVLPGSKIVSEYGSRHKQPWIRGATPDLGAVVFGSEEALTPMTTSGVGEKLYEWTKANGGRIAPVSVLPGNTPIGYEATLGHQNAIKNHAISADGTHVAWEYDEGGPGKEYLYLRDMPREETVRVDTTEPGARGGPSRGIIQGCERDGFAGAGLLYGSGAADH